MVFIEEIFGIISNFNGNNSEEKIIHTYVDSEKINNYETPFISEIDFSDKFEEDEEGSEGQL